MDFGLGLDNWRIKNSNVKFPECNIICIFRAIKHQIKYQSMPSKKYKERLLKCNITSVAASLRQVRECGVMSEPEGGPGQAGQRLRLRCSLPLSCWTFLERGENEGVK